MGANLIFGYTGFVAVQDVSGNDLYRSPIQSKKEMDDWIKANELSVEGWGITKSSFVPVRVDNCDDFSKDLFLPTFVNHVLKINNLFFKLLASIFALPWDVLTLPCRLIGVFFRLADKEERLPVHRLIENNPSFEGVRKNGVVRLVAHLEYTWVTKTFSQLRQAIRGEGVDGPLGDVPFEAVRESEDVLCEVYLKALPWLQNKKQKSTSVGLFRRGSEGEWNCQGLGSSKSSLDCIGA
jgi:hypothetical protein